MEENLFARLLKYSPTEKRTQKENFFTEVLAFIYRQIPALAEEVAGAILETTSTPRVSRIETQHWHEKGIIDLVMELEDSPTILFEHKLDSGVHYVNDEEMEDKTQLDSYLEIAQEYDARVVLVSRYDLQLDSRITTHPLFLGHRRWHDVYGIIEDASNKRFVPAEVTHRDAFLVDTLLGFMEEENMKRLDSIRIEEKGMLEAYETFRDKLRKFLDKVLKTLRKEYEIEYDGKRHEGTHYYYGLVKANGTSVWISLWYSSQDLLSPSLCVFDDLGGKEKDLELRGFYYQDQSYNLDPKRVPDDFFEWEVDEQVNWVCDFFRVGLNALVDLCFIRRREVAT